MAQTTFKKNIYDAVSEKYTLTSRDMGDLARVKKGVYRFDFEAFDVEGIGNLFFINMSAMFGLMKMETAVLTPVTRDLSFSNFDVIHAAGNDTFLFEMYKTAVGSEDLSAFEGVKEKYKDLPDYVTEPRWYDEVKLPSSLGKKGKKAAARHEEVLKDCLNTYLEALDKAPACDPEAKKAANRTYVDRLLKEGGVAVDSMKKIIGDAKTDRLIREFMYNV